MERGERIKAGQVWLLSSSMSVVVEHISGSYVLAVKIAGYNGLKELTLGEKLSIDKCIFYLDGSKVTADNFYTLNRELRLKERVKRFLDYSQGSQVNFWSYHSPFQDGCDCGKLSKINKN